MLSVEQISQLAPDAASLKAGREQAKPSKWQGTGGQGELLWGRVQGSGKEPYQTVIDLQGPAYSCSCPSRKFPCKHSLGLLFVAAESAPPTTEPPAWVVEWSSKRAASAEKKAAREQAPADALTPEHTADREQAATRRSERRDKLMSEGLAQTQVWLEDLLGHGLAWAQAQPGKFWLDQVARLTNAQLSGAARMVEECQATAHSGDGWASRLLGELSRLHLLCRSWAGADRLDPDRAAELRAMLGVPSPQESVLAQDGVSGTWQVLARVYEEREKLRTYRHWLFCHETGQVTQVFSFAAGAQPLDTSLPPGLVFEAEPVFYPGIAPLRALIKRRTSSSAQAQILTARHDAALQPSVRRATAMWANQPWLRQVPLLFTATPRADLGGFVDEAGSFLAWTPSFPNAWLLLALGGGRPLHLFGELQSTGFTPLWAVEPQSRRLWNQRFER